MASGSGVGTNKVVVNRLVGDVLHLQVLAIHKTDGLCVPHILKILE